MHTFIAPMPIVAYSDCDVVSPADKKICVEKKMACKTSLPRRLVPVKPFRDTVAKNLLFSFSTRFRDECLHSKNSENELNTEGRVIKNKWCIMAWAVKKMISLTQLIPDNCWASIIIMDMISGNFREGLVTISLRVTVGTSFMLSYSFLISSISSMTSTLSLSHVRAALRRIRIEEERRNRESWDVRIGWKWSTWTDEKNLFGPRLLFPARSGCTWETQGTEGEWRAGK